MGIPVQMLNDRTKVNKPFSQIGFIEVLIGPLEIAKTKLFPKLHQTTTFLEHNIQQWSKLWVEENNPSEEDREKVAGRVRRLSDKLEDARINGLPATDPSGRHTVHSLESYSPSVESG